MYRYLYLCHTLHKIPLYICIFQYIDYTLYSDRVGEGFVHVIKAFTRKAQFRYTKWPVNAAKNFYISESFRRFGGLTWDTSYHTQIRREWSYVKEACIYTETLQSILLVDDHFYLLGIECLYEVEITPLNGKVSFFTFAVSAVEDSAKITDILGKIKRADNCTRPCLLLNNTPMLEVNMPRSFVIMAKYGDTYNPTIQTFVPLMDAITDYHVL